MITRVVPAFGAGTTLSLEGLAPGPARDRLPSGCCADPLVFKRHRTGGRYPKVLRGSPSGPRGPEGIYRRRFRGTRYRNGNNTRLVAPWLCALWHRDRTCVKHGLTMLDLHLW